MGKMRNVYLPPALDHGRVAKRTKVRPVFVGLRNANPVSVLVFCKLHKKSLLFWFNGLGNEPKQGDTFTLLLVFPRPLFCEFDLNFLNDSPPKKHEREPENTQGITHKWKKAVIRKVGHPAHGKGAH